MLKNQVIKKILVVFLIIALTYANIVLIGSNIVKGLISYAAEENEEVEAKDKENEDIEEKPILEIETRDIHKARMEEETEYLEKLNINLSSRKEKTNLAIEDISNDFYDKSSNPIDGINLKYKQTKINKEDLKNLLGEEGILRIVDVEEEKDLLEITKGYIEEQEEKAKIEKENNKEENKIEEDEEKEENITIEIKDEEETIANVIISEEEITIEYIKEVRKIRIELENIPVKEEVVKEEVVEVEEENEEMKEEEPSKIVVENTKVITNVSDIEGLDCMKESIKYTINKEAEKIEKEEVVASEENQEESKEEQEVEELEEETIEKTIKFKDTITRASMELDNTEWTIGETNKVKYKITLDTSSEKSELYVNPMLLIELPKSVETVNTQNSEYIIDNDNGAFTNAKVFMGTVLENKYIVILPEGEQTAETIKNGNTTIDLTLELKVKENVIQEIEETKLYYRNDTVTAYENGTSFDTANINVNLMAIQEPTEQNPTPNESDPEEITPGEHESEILSFSMTSHSTVEGDFAKPGTDIVYDVTIYNYQSEDALNLALIDTLPSEVTLKDVAEITENEDGEEQQKKIDYDYDEAARNLKINIDKIEGIQIVTANDEEDDVIIGQKKYKITVGVNEIEEEGKEIINTLSLQDSEGKELLTVQNKNYIQNKKNIRVTSYATIEGNEVVKPGEKIIYDIEVFSYDKSQIIQNLVLIDTLPEGVTLKEVVEVTEDENGEEQQKTIDYNYNKSTRELKINIDNQGGQKYRITVEANKLEEGVYSKEVSNFVSLQDKNGKEIATAENINTIADEFLKITAETLKEKVYEQEEITLVLKIENVGDISVKPFNIDLSLPNEITPKTYKKVLMSEAGAEERNSEGTFTNKFTNIVVPAHKTLYLYIIGTVNDVEEEKQITITGNVNGEEVSWTTTILNETIPPTDPDNPDNPDNPNNPDNPDNPNNPNNPNDPDNPNNPSNPDNPDNPNNPNDPSNPDNPNNPETRPDRFDLSLAQYLSKITVTNSQGTTTYDYTDTNFAKVEIHRKYMNGSKVRFEYKIKVKNEGTIAGYARKIVDYLPSDLTFNKDLNQDWYVGEDGNIYSVSLMEKLLNPGEEAELTLVLEKTMTNSNTGTVSNIAEIYEATNEQNVEDINSIPGDKIEGQNDMSKVEVLIAVKTGTVIMYITLAITVIAILGIGTYNVRKITLNKKGGC